MRSNSSESESQPDPKDSSSSEDGPLSASQILEHTLYDELRKLAAAKLARENPGQTLQATALVHEAYIRLVDGEKARDWDSRAHFFSAAAEAMRRILVESARRKRAKKRGGQWRQQELENVQPSVAPPNDDILALNEAIEKLETVDPNQAQVVKLRYFAGLTVPQVAALLNISSSTVDNYWAYARAWLHVALSNEADS